MNTSLCNLDNQPAVSPSRHLLTTSRLRKTLITLAGLLFLGAIVWSQPSIDLDQYAVYSAFLDAYSSDTSGTRQVVVFDHTVSPNDLSTEQTDYVIKQLSELQPETLADFLGANDQAYSLLAHFNISRPYTLISRAELETIAQDKSYFDFWDGFHARYSDTPLFRFSRVGFNREHNQALVYISVQMFSRSGIAGYLLYTKTGGVWVFVNSVTDWVS